METCRTTWRAVAGRHRDPERREQETERIDENMPPLALDQLAGIEAMRINAGPFSALFML